jgi:hypothetical protein
LIVTTHQAEEARLPQTQEPPRLSAGRKTSSELTQQQRHACHSSCIHHYLANKLNVDWLIVSSADNLNSAVMISIHGASLYGSITDDDESSGQQRVGAAAGGYLMVAAASQAADLSSSWFTQPLIHCCITYPHNAPREMAGDGSEILTAPLCQTGLSKRQPLMTHSARRIHRHNQSTTSTRKSCRVGLSTPAACSCSVRWAGLPAALSSQEQSPPAAFHSSPHQQQQQQCPTVSIQNTAADEL